MSMGRRGRRVILARVGARRIRMRMSIGGEGVDEDALDDL